MTTHAKGYKHTATAIILKESLKCKENFQMLFSDSLKSSDENPHLSRVLFHDWMSFFFF